MNTITYPLPKRILSQSVAILLLLACLVVSPFAFTQTLDSTLAGRVVSVSGKVYAESHQGEARVLERSASIHVGDTIAVGPASSAQIRFIDNAIVAFKEDTVFRVEAYSQGNPEQDDGAILELVKGGMRTITGTIAKEAYTTRVRNYAYIGIRGTEYQIVIVEDGRLLMGIYEGGIITGNLGGQLDLGLGAEFDFAQVVDAFTAPEGLQVEPLGLGSIPIERDLLVDAGDLDAPDDTAPGGPASAQAAGGTPPAAATSLAVAGNIPGNGNAGLPVGDTVSPSTVNVIAAQSATETTLIQFLASVTAENRGTTTQASRQENEDAPEDRPDGAALPGSDALNGTVTSTPEDATNTLALAPAAPLAARPGFTAAQAGNQVSRANPVSRIRQSPASIQAATTGRAALVQEIVTTNVTAPAQTVREVTGIVESLIALTATVQQPPSAQAPAVSNDAVTVVTSSAVGTTAETVETLSEVADAAVETTAETLATAADTVAEAAAAVTETAIAVAAPVTDAVASTANAVAEAAAAVTETAAVVAAPVTEAVASTTDTISEVVETAAAVIEPVTTTVEEVLANETVVEAVETATEVADAAIETAAQTIATATDTVAEAAAAVTETAAVVAAPVTDAVASTTNAVAEAAAAVTETAEIGRASCRERV